MNKTKRITLIALLTAITVVLAKLVAINLPIIRIGAEFISIALASALFGPAWGALSAVLADILGGFLFPTGPFSPIISLVAISNGLIYGFFLHNKKITIKRTIFTVIVKALVSDFVLMTLALYLLYKTPLQELLLARSIKTLAVMVIESLVIFLVIRPIIEISNKKQG